MQGTLAISMILYTAVLFGIAVWARSKIRNAEDFIVAGRRLPFSLATGTLLATWFGAGTLIVTADRIRDEGLRAAVFEPIGPGICLLLAGIFFARPLWEARILTLSDLFRRRYGRKAEVVSVLYQASFLGWIATQLLSLAGILEVFFELERSQGILLVASVAMIYTLVGGMWSVTVTDAVQLVLLGTGLFVLSGEIFAAIGSGSVSEGLSRIAASSNRDDLVLIPTEKLEEFMGWLSLFVAGTLGILPGQDLLQRVFSSRSSRVAVASCLTAGVLYILLGAFPILFGLAGNLFADADGNSSPIVPFLAKTYLSGAMQVFFTLTLLSVILSSIDSAILAPSSILAQNFLRELFRGRVSTYRLTQLCCVGVTAASVALALSGRHASELLEGSYAMGLPQFVVMGFAVYQKRTHAAAGIVTLGLGISLWVLEVVWRLAVAPVFGVELENLLPVPFYLVVLAGSLLAYVVTDRIAGLAARSRA